MAINFPINPLVGDQYTYNGKTWRWDGSYWIFVSSTNTLSSATTVGGGVSIISGISNSVLYLKSLTGGVTDNGNTISISGGSGSSGSTTFTGGTVSGATNFTGGLSANTISATTYQNLPTDIRVTGGTYLNGTATFTNNTGGTFTVSGFSTSTSFTGGTVTGATNFTGGLSANTISATTYFNLPSLTGAYLPLSGGTVTGGTQFTGGLTANTISATTYYNVSSNFQYEIHVSQIDGNNTTGNGTLLNPVASITQALTLLTGSRKTIIVHPGTYTENVTVASGNTTIATSELTGANTLLSGTLTIGSLGSGSRISGLKMSNLVISGTAQAYISNCTVDTNVTKSSSGYVEIINTEMQCISGIQISGSGTTIINGNKNVGVSVSNASAQVIIKGCNSVVTPSASAGNLAIVDCVVTALGGNAITITGALTNLTLANSQVLVQAGNNVAPISVAGIYSIFNTVYDKANSSLTGTNTNSVDYFQFINADKFITQGGTSLQYVMGDGSLSNGFTGGTVTGATNFTGGITANTISATTITADDTPKVIYRLPNAVNVGNTTAATVTTITTFDITGLPVGMTIVADGLFSSTSNANQKTYQLSLSGASSNPTIAQTTGGNRGQLLMRVQGSNTIRMSLVAGVGVNTAVNPSFVDVTGASNVFTLQARCTVNGTGGGVPVNTLESLTLTRF